MSDYLNSKFNQYFSIQAFKPYDENRLIACNIDDEEACKFIIRYPGMTTQTPFEIEDKYLAKELRNIFFCIFHEGAESKLEELRYFLGIK